MNWLWLATKCIQCQYDSGASLVRITADSWGVGNRMDFQFRPNVQLEKDVCLIFLVTGRPSWFAKLIAQLLLCKVLHLV